MYGWKLNPFGSLLIAFDSRILFSWWSIFLMISDCWYYSDFLFETINSLTAIRFRWEQKTPAPYYSFGRNSTESTVNHQPNNPQTSPPRRSRSPLLWRGIYGPARSDAGNLFGRGWARALCLGLVLNIKITAQLIKILFCLCLQRIARPPLKTVAKAASIVGGWCPKNTNRLIT